MQRKSYHPIRCLLPGGEQGDKSRDDVINQNVIVILPAAKSHHECVRAHDYGKQ